MASAYLWLKVGHILAVISWMAAFLYLPRLMVYHADAAPGSDKSETFKVMERRLLRGIMTPAMIATWVFGIALATVADAWVSGWLHAKLLLVLGLSAMHGMNAGWVRAFAEDRNTRSGRFFRIVNEIPAVALILIVILVVLKPF
ncbi:protoporphyrinogen oxidase HemJ [Amorphus coralli]|uniref:protoporphyrinogen oxidase HemJ n=1 Tax=Amorphus coralli TaxID=340680 RepID=UPI0003800FCA|nr:protoporphyrinogen oxidase HemJ [Amorphus coralli]